MSKKNVTQEFDKTKIAYDIAIALAIKSWDGKDLQALLKTFDDKYNECLEGVTTFQKQNKKPPFKISDTL